MNLNKIKHLINHIENNFDREILPSEIEQISNYCYRNIQRVFKSIFKETLGGFQKRYRLETGFKKIIYSNDSISEISLAVGFQNVSSFSKAIQKKYNTTPTQIRADKKNIFKNFIEESKQPIARVKPEIVFLEAKEIFYKTIKTTQYNNDQINQAWEKIYLLQENDSDIDYFGIINDQPLITINTPCRYDLCIDKNPNDKNFHTKLIFGKKYAKYIHFGAYDRIEDTYRAIYYDWLYNSKYEIDSSPMIERYKVHGINTNNEQDYITEIFVPIK